MAERRTRVGGPGRSGPGRGRGEGRRRSRAPGSRTEAPVDPDTATAQVVAQEDVPEPVGQPTDQSDHQPAPGAAESTAERPASTRRTRRRRPAEERNRRRFARRQWARRWLRWRAVVAMVVLLALAGAGGWVLMGSSWLAVEDVEVTGTELLGERQVASVADVPEEQPLARVDLEAVERRVESLAEVESATITRSWPHAVSVRVTERRAIAVVQMAGRLRGMDVDGVLFRDFGRAPAGLPRVDMPAGTTSEAMLEAARVIQALPGELVPRVDHVEVGSMDAISLVLRGGRTVVWGSADESEAKAEVAGALLSAVPAQVYDVSVPGQPTTNQ